MIEKPNKYNFSMRIWPEKYIDLLNKHPIISSDYNSYLKNEIVCIDVYNENTGHKYHSLITDILDYLMSCKTPLKGGKYYSEEDYKLVLSKMNEVLKLYKEYQVEIALNNLKKDFI